MFGRWASVLLAVLLGGCAALAPYSDGSPPHVAIASVDSSYHEHGIIVLRLHIEHDPLPSEGRLGALQITSYNITFVNTSRSTVVPFVGADVATPDARHTSLNITPYAAPEGENDRLVRVQAIRAVGGVAAEAELVVPPVPEAWRQAGWG